MMTTQEAQALREFLAQLTQVQGVAKDPQASNMIGTAFAQQPDAGYLLVQRSMLQDQALATARAQIEQLQEQVQAQSQRESARGMSAGGGFLDPANAWGNTPVQGARAPVAQQRFGTAPAPQYVPQAAPQYAPAAAPASGGLFGGGGGGFLGSMAATAAGVAGGAFLFQGIESLMGHHGGGSGLMGQNNALPTENTTINNFYGSENDAPVASGDGDIDRLSAADDSGGNDDLGSSDDMSSI